MDSYQPVFGGEWYSKSASGLFTLEAKLKQNDQSRFIDLRVYKHSKQIFRTKIHLPFFWSHWLSDGVLLLADAGADYAVLDLTSEPKLKRYDAGFKWCQIDVSPDSTMICVTGLDEKSSSIAVVYTLDLIDDEPALSFVGRLDDHEELAIPAVIGTEFLKWISPTRIKVAVESAFGNESVLTHLELDLAHSNNQRHQGTVG